MLATRKRDELICDERDAEMEKLVKAAGSCKIDFGIAPPLSKLLVQSLHHFSGLTLHLGNDSH